MKTDLVVGMPDENRPRGRNARRVNAQRTQTSLSECPTKTDLVVSMPARENALGMRQCPLGVERHSITVWLPGIPSA